MFHSIFWNDLAWKGKYKNALDSNVSLGVVPINMITIGPWNKCLYHFVFMISVIMPMFLKWLKINLLLTQRTGPKVQPKLSLSVNSFTCVSFILGAFVTCTFFFSNFYFFPYFLISMVKILKFLSPVPAPKFGNFWGLSPKTCIILVFQPPKNPRTYEKL